MSLVIWKYVSIIIYVEKEGLASVIANIEHNVLGSAVNKRHLSFAQYQSKCLKKKNKENQIPGILITNYKWQSPVSS